MSRPRAYWCWANSCCVIHLRLELWVLAVCWESVFSSSRQILGKHQRIKNKLSLISLYECIWKYTIELSLSNSRVTSNCSLQRKILVYLQEQIIFIQSRCFCSAPSGFIFAFLAKYMAIVHAIYDAKPLRRPRSVPCCDVNTQVLDRIPFTHAIW